MQMELDDSQVGCTGVRLVGRLDAAGADALSTPFTAAIVAANRPAWVDLAQVEFVSSMGIRLLVSTAKAQRLKGHALVFFDAQPRVQQTFEDACVDQVLQFAPDRSNAMAMMGPAR